ncbi:MAG: hypothetical protein QNJ43_25165 [Breoghania sp.]|nr:hypothetical protein [Breoghania sp.]
MQPNHAWRHRFRNLIAREGIDSRTTNHITGNAQGNVGQQYGDPEVRTMHDAIEKLPCYEVPGT